MSDIYRAVSGIVVRRLPLSTPFQACTDSTVHNLYRLPKETVYLLVKKPRKMHAWQFPQGGQDPGETALEAALRELEEECGTEIKVDIVNRAPVGSYKYKFPPNFKRWDTSIGANVSFFLSNWLEGQCRPDGKEIVDFAWLSNDELFQYVSPEYKNTIASFL